MHGAMISLRAPVSAGKIENWVTDEVNRLRRRGRTLGVVLGRLVPAAPAQSGDWVVDVHVRGRDGRLEDDLVLGSILVDLELLGLRPELVVTEAPRREPSSPSKPPSPGHAVGHLSWPAYTLDPMERRN